MKIQEVVKRLVDFRNSERARILVDSWNKNVTSEIEGVLHRSLDNIRIARVGGVVRDELMGLSPKDVDYLVTGLTQSEFEELFPEAKIVGAGFPVYLMDVDGDRETEFALARTEKKDGVGYNGFIANTDPRLTFKDDLLRRDLTINAMAIDLETEELIDPFGGRSDLKKGIIRATSEAFSEDPLRVYRAARFAARYGFIIADDTKEMMMELITELRTLPGERILLEVSKTLKEGKPSIFFETLSELGELYIHFGEFRQLEHFTPEKFQKTMQRIDNMETKSENVRFAVLTNLLSQTEIADFCDRIKATIEMKQLSQFLNKNFEKVERFDELQDDEIVSLLTQINRHPLTMQAESLGKDDVTEWFIEAFQALANADKKETKFLGLLNKVKNFAKELADVRISSDETVGLVGKEIGMYLQKKKIEKITMLRKRC